MDPLDLDEARRLAESLHTHLDSVRSSDPDILALRQEVERLRSVLNAPGAHPGTAREALHDVRSMTERIAESVAGETLRDSQYVAQIGRILGLS